MSLIFNFGETVQEHDFKVINEREARASAGIMFLFGIISFFYFALTQNMLLLEVFSITFIIEFFIRTVINPIYAPYMMLGWVFVSNQQPEWVEAKPKQFAWILGMVLGLIMSYYIVFDIVEPIRMIVCMLCLVLLFTESVFGICIGCIIYKKLNVKLQKCPGGVCEMPHEKPKRTHKLISIFFIALMFFATFTTMKSTRYTATIDAEFEKSVQEDDDFINGDEEEDNENKDEEKMKKENTPVKEEIQKETKEANKDCEPPQWAIDMGHREIWKKHHGCE